MTTAGIDFSTNAVDVVLLDESGAATWHHFPLTGSDAFDRSRAVRDALPARTSEFWDDVVACAIEEPAGKLTGRLFRVQGAILACLPPSLLVEKLMPSQWRKAVGLAGNCSKDEVMEYAHVRLALGRVPLRLRSVADLLAWGPDACDAYCLALAVAGMVEVAA